MIDWSDLSQVLTALASGAGLILLGPLFSWLAERWPAFQALDSVAKRVVIGAACVVTSLAAWAVVTFVPPETLAALSEPFRVAVGALIMFVGSQWWHMGVQKQASVITLPTAGLASVTLTADVLPPPELPQLAAELEVDDDDTDEM